MGATFAPGASHNAALPDAKPKAARACARLLPAERVRPPASGNARYVMRPSEAGAGGGWVFALLACRRFFRG